MADVRPFKAVRPAGQLAARIAALPYDVMDTEEARVEVLKEPFSFLQIDRAEVNFPKGTDPYGQEVYQKAAEIFHSMLQKGSFIREEKECYYLYELTMNGRTQAGIGAVCAVDDYVNRVIRKHENTREEKERDRICHVDALNAQTGPIFLAYRAHEGIRELICRLRKEKEPVYDFTSPDGITHRITIIEAEEDIRTIRDAFRGMDRLYIADGHHRAASAVKVALKRREALKGSGEEAHEAEHDFFLAVLFGDDELQIMDYNRVVKDLNGLSEDRFFDRLRKKFEVEEAGDEPVHPKEKGTFGMYISGKWYLLTARETARSEDPVAGLDVSILQNEVLSPILGIEDPKKDSRIDFIGGIRGLEALTQRVDRREAMVAFSMYPTSIQELFATADAGELMPPKSTWFEPKLRSGLLIHQI
ncbi:MAG: DUF1015 family protein [Lachnospiraceae bacterium]|nr:DUF1015 family protein [Lachnospiraceae bacterium]